MRVHRHSLKKRLWASCWKWMQITVGVARSNCRLVQFCIVNDLNFNGEEKTKH